MKRNTIYILAILVLFIIPTRLLAQQPNLIKVSEYNIQSLHSIEERVSLLHAIQQSDVFSYIYNETEGKFDIFVPKDYTCDDASESPDFEMFLENWQDEWTVYSNLDKQERGRLYVEWRYQLDDNTFRAANEDFYRFWRNYRDGNGTCEGALPFCTDEGLYDFPASTNVPNMGSYDPYYCYGVNHQGQDNCLRTSPNPAFYFMRIAESGNLDIYIYTQPAHDVDFDCWGPFDDPETACEQLSCSNMVDCSYSAASTEHCHINNAQPGKYYLLLITNYSDQECNIYFENQSTGATDCSLLPPLANNSGPYCVGETIHLSSLSEEYAGASYQWLGPNDYTSRFQNPNISNCTMEMAGTYTCTITNNGRTASATTEVIIYPQPEASFTATTACVDTPTQFDASSSTTNPPGYNIANYEWNFGDGTTGSGVTTSHTYAQAGTYTVTLNVSDADGHCSDVAKQTVIVGGENEDYPVTICEGESYTFNGVTYTQEGDYPITIQTEGCQSTATLHLTVSHLDVHIEVEPNDSICEGDTVMLHAAIDSSYIFVAVGDILCTDNSIVKPYHWPCGKTPKGIVFYVDDSHLHRYAVSLTQSGPMKWSTSTNDDIQQLQNYTHWRDAIQDFDGLSNTRIIRQNGNANTYPAAWNVDFDNGWYLPSAGQVNLLYGELMDVNASLTLVGGALIVDPTGTYGTNNGDVYLWSSTEWNASQAMCIKIMDGLVKSVNKSSSDKYYVRSIINF